MFARRGLKYKKNDVVFSDTSTSPPWTPLYPGSRLEQEAIQYIHKFYCKDCQMDQQAAERAKAAAASGEENSACGTAEASVPAHPPELVPDVKQEPASPMSPQQMTDEASLMVTLDKNKECKYHTCPYLIFLCPYLYLSFHQITKKKIIFFKFNCDNSFNLI